MSAPVTSGVVVTGGASGIGLATAAALVAAGRPVAIWDLGAERVQSAVESLGTDVPVFGAVVDVTDHQRVTEAVAESKAALGSIGGLVHSAGNIISEPVGEIDWSHWSLQIDVHLNSYPRIVQELLPHLQQSEGSAVVAISSINGLVAESFNPAYCAAKAGLLGVTRSISAHLGPQGIRANAICPGYIVTPIVERALSNAQTHDIWVDRASLKRLGAPEEIGSVARFLLSRDASFITGQTIVVDGGVTTSV